MGRDKRVWRKLVKKLRRQRIRRQVAGSVDASKQQNSAISLFNDNEGEQENSTTMLDYSGEISVDRRYFISGGEWEARERLIELQNAMKAAEEEKFAKAKAEEEKRIREEWVAKELREAAEKEAREKEELARKQRQARMTFFQFDKLEFCRKVDGYLGSGICHWNDGVMIMDEEFNQFLEFLCGDIETPPMRFVMPENYNESGQEVCQLFSKTGACRFGDSCKLIHLVPTLSQIILIPNFFYNFLLAENLKDEYDSDVGLECDEKELYKEFIEFYDDVLPEFRKHGKVIQFKVCRNLESHLRGNVYIQFDSIRSAVEAFRTFNGRFYNGKQISLRFVKIDSWKAAICWSFLRSSCIRGRSCNYLHVFRNPTKEFVFADRDFKENTQKIVPCAPPSSLHSSRKRSRWNDQQEQPNTIPPLTNDQQTEDLSFDTDVRNTVNMSPKSSTTESATGHDLNISNSKIDLEPTTSHKRKSKKKSRHNHGHKKNKKHKKKKSKKSKKDHHDK